MNGLPLVHVNIGWGRTAKGVIAVGLKAYGIVAAGLLACGVFSFGLLAVGLIAIGDMANGGIALGGSSANGKVFSATVTRFRELAPQIYEQFDAVPSVFSVFTGWCKYLFEEVLNGNVVLGGIKL